MNCNIVGLLVVRLHIRQYAGVYGNEGGLVQVQKLFPHLSYVGIRSHSRSLNVGQQLFVVLFRHPLLPQLESRFNSAVPPASDEVANLGNARSGMNIVAFSNMTGSRGIYIVGEAVNVGLGQINVWFYIRRVGWPEVRSKLGPEAKVRLAQKWGVVGNVV